jgi:hypothetical protein
LLHQASRVKGDAGRVVATLDDYAAVRELVADLVAEGVDATVKPEIREVVEAIARLLGEGRDEVRQADLKEVLKLDKSAISRRVAGALDGAFLKKNCDRLKHRAEGHIRWREFQRCPFQVADQSPLLFLRSLRELESTGGARHD